MMKPQITNYKLQITGLFIAASLFLLAIFIPVGVTAATLYLDPVQATLGPDDTLEVKVKIGVGSGECLNAFQVGITFPADILELKDFNSGESLISLWVPKAPDKDSLKIANGSGKLIFSGGIPGGYCGKIPGDPGDSNILGALILAPKKPIVFQEANLDFSSETQLLLNDGLGTVAALKTQGARLTLDGNLKAKNDDWAAKVAADNIPPEPFIIEISNSPRIAAGKYFAVFSATDKQTGIDHYEVLETLNPATAAGNHSALEGLWRLIFKAKPGPAPVWETAGSPYVLKDQALRSLLEVKAVDRAGNERVVEFNEATGTPAIASALNFQELIAAAIILLFCALAAVLALLFWKKRKGKAI